jgi:NodT family efflux transporter outer membrane factor (OMF) lipoprotein
LPFALAALAALVVLAGCVPSLADNPAREPHKETPASFGGGARDESAPATTSLAQKTWSDLFASPALRALIGEALRDNRELGIQLQELVIVQNEISTRQGETLPRVSASAGAGVEKTSKHTSQGVSDDAHGLPENLGNFTFGLAASWEVDIWRRLRNATDAARLRYRATVEARHFLQTQLVAEIARSYYELVSLDVEIETVRRNLDVQKNALEVVRLEKLAARVTELAVQRFEAEVLKNQSRLYDLEQERVQAENRINFLVGRFPQPVKRSVEDFRAPVPEALSAGLPSELLANRPDVRRAELELEASKLDVKSAKAAFYPSLTLDAGLGYRAFSAEHLVATPESLFYGLAGSLTAPLLNRRAIEAQYRSANARQIQAVLGYEKALLQAFTDAVNQIAVIENLRKASELQQQQVARLASAVEISNVLFQSARADYMEVLLTRRDSLEAEVSLLETKRRQWLAVTGLYQALGGGWR